MYFPVKHTTKTNHICMWLLSVFFFSFLPGGIAAYDELGVLWKFTAQDLSIVCKILAGLWICRFVKLERLILPAEGSVKEVGLLVSLSGRLSMWLSVSVSISSFLISSSSLSESVSRLLPEPKEWVRVSKDSSSLVTNLININSRIQTIQLLHRNSY